MFMVIVEKTETKIGRPRCEEAKQSILRATWQLLEKKGFPELTIEGVAEKAGVGKATVYRWWPNKSALVVDAFFHHVNPRVHFPDTGSIRQDVTIQMEELVKVMNSRLGRILRALLGGGQSDPELLAAFRNKYMEPRRTEGREIIQRAIKRGELRRDLDPDLVMDALYGPIYFRFLAEHEPLDSAFINDLCALVLGGMLVWQRGSEGRWD
jgi:AcrR family transcriptional regulator